MIIAGHYDDPLDAPFFEFTPKRQDFSQRGNFMVSEDREQVARVSLLDEEVDSKLALGVIVIWRPADEHQGSNALPA